jgi:hypothetical protein
MPTGLQRGERSMTKNSSRWRVAVSLAAALIATFAPAFTLAGEHGDGEVVRAGQTTGQSMTVKDGSNWRVVTGTAGGLNIANPPQGWIYRYQSVLQDTMSRWGAPKQGGRGPDSTAVYKADGATTWVVEIYPSFAPLSAGHLMAISFGRHPVQSRDSLSTYIPVSRYSHPIGTTGATPGDTLGSLLDFLTNIGQPAFVDSLIQPGETALPIGPGPTPRGRSYVFTNISTDWISLRLRILQTFTTGAGGLAATDGANLVFTFRINLYGYR